MGNIYGVANPEPVGAVYGTASAADVTLTAGAEVTCFTTGALVAPSPGNWFPMLWCVFAVVMGATASAALKFAFKLGSGADVASYVVEPGMLVNSAEFTITIPLIGVADPNAWVGSGSTINITGKATTTACTVKGVGSQAMVQLLRGSD